MFSLLLASGYKIALCYSCLKELSRRDRAVADFKTNPILGAIVPTAAPTLNFAPPVEDGMTCTQRGAAGFFRRLYAFQKPWFRAAKPGITVLLVTSIHPKPLLSHDTIILIILRHPDAKWLVNLNGFLKRTRCTLLFPATSLAIIQDMLV